MSIPPPLSLGDGIHLIPAPLPFKSPAWVNVYAIEARGGILMIDCGTDWQPGREAITSGFRALGLDERAVHTLLVSHLHPDHVGMSSRLVSELGCRFVMHRRARKRVARYNDTPGTMRRLQALAATHGAPLASIGGNNVTRADYMPVIEPPDHLIDDGNEIDIGDGRSLLVLHTPGHEPSHICLRDSRTGILFAGDHILPRISPVIMFEEELVDPLGDYMSSLRRLIDLGIGLTYPAHGTLVERGDERALQILLHHERRLGDMAALVSSSPVSAWSVVTKSFRPNLEPMDARLAFLETLSHLEHLRLAGRARRLEDEGAVVYTS